jgi:hypothetical protein
VPILAAANSGYVVSPVDSAAGPTVRACLRLAG